MRKKNRVPAGSSSALLKGVVSHKAHGAILIEAAMGVSLFAVVLLGFAHLYSVQLEKMKHLQLLTEIAMGPQERTLVFDSTPGADPAFRKLDSATTPSITEFADTIGEFFTEKRAIDGTVLYLRLVYIPIDSETGLSTQQQVQGAGDIFRYQVQAQVGKGEAVLEDSCLALDESHRDALNTFSDTRGAQMASYRDPGTNAPLPIGTKLYDVNLNNARYTGYVDYLPIVYIRICSQPYNFLFPQVAVSTYELIPRRLVN